MTEFLVFPEGDYRLKIEKRTNNKITNVLFDLCSRGIYVQREIKLNRDYLIFHIVENNLNACLNTVFHKYSGTVFILPKTDPFRDQDILFLQEFADNVYKKGKRPYSNVPH